MTVPPSVLHTITAELHVGMLTLAAFCIILIVVTKLYLKISRSLRWEFAVLGGLRARLNRLAEKIIEYAEPTSVVATLGGVIALVVSAYTGFLMAPAGTMVYSPLLMNKVMISIFALEFWVILLIIRAKYGRKIWNHSPLSMVYTVIGLTAFLFTVVSGSLGGHLAGKGSALDPLYNLVGVNPENFFALGTFGIYALIGICILVGILFAYIYRKPKKVSFWCLS
ncbi:MAG: hypothetical protein ACE5R6_20820 [Candidatus Heimdallarchaeota archaeon]